MDGRQAGNHRSKFLHVVAKPATRSFRVVAGKNFVDDSYRLRPRFSLLFSSQFSFATRTMVGYRNWKYVATYSPPYPLFFQPFSARRPCQTREYSQKRGKKAKMAHFFQLEERANAFPRQRFESVKFFQLDDSGEECFFLPPAGRRKSRKIIFARLPQLVV